MVRRLQRSSTFLDLLTTPSGYNDGKYTNAKVEGADDRCENRQRIRRPTTPMVEQILAEEMPSSRSYHYTSVFMLNSSIGGWPVDNVEQNWYSRDLYKVAE